MEIDFSTTKLKDRIVKYLQDRYRKTGVNAAVSWRGIWIEFGVKEEDFNKALKAAANARPGHAEIVFVDSDHVKLGPKWT